ncbi:MAG: VOC family protein [Erysipelotrichaceae bacterium]|nr:VOC family protein [Erysipelotrichaceae bacterium]
MINGMNHVALIVSKEESLDFYRKLGFRETSRKVRPEKNDVLIMMENNGAVLEVFIRPDAPLRLCKPEAYGCRHIAFDVDNLEEILEVLKDYKAEPIRTTETGRRLVFISDSDDQPVEFMEKI